MTFIGKKKYTTDGYSKRGKQGYSLWYNARLATDLHVQYAGNILTLIKDSQRTWKLLFNSFSTDAKGPLLQL